MKKIVRGKRKAPKRVGKKFMDDLAEAMLSKLQERKEKERANLTLVNVVFPSGGKEYTYLAPKNHGLSHGDKVETPSGPARVSGFPTYTLYEQNTGNQYKRLVAKYVPQRFKY